MNRTLFTPRLHLLLAGLLVVVFCVWLLASGTAPGSREDSARTLLLASGWGALLLMAICLLYVPRKHAYKWASRWRALKLALSGTREGLWLRKLLGGYPSRDPEDGSPLASGVISKAEQERSERARRLRERQEALERAETKVGALRLEIQRGLVETQAEVRRRVTSIVRTERLGGIVRAVVRRGKLTSHESPFVIRLVATEPLARMARWLHAHLYYGLAFGAIVWLHGGGSVSSPLGAAMTILSAVVVVTGVAGTVLFALGPRWLTPEEPDLGFEQAHALGDHLERKILAHLKRPVAASVLAGISGEEPAAWKEEEIDRLLGGESVLTLLGRERISQLLEQVTGSLPTEGEVDRILSDGRLSPLLPPDRRDRLARLLERFLLEWGRWRRAPESVLDEGRLSSVLEGTGDSLVKSFLAASGVAPDGPVLEAILRGKRTDEILRAAEGLEATAAVRLRDLAVLLEQRRRFRASFERLGRIKLWINLWRAVHVPASLVLTGLVVVHIVAVSRY